MKTDPWHIDPLGASILLPDAITHHTRPARPWPEGVLVDEFGRLFITRADAATVLVVSQDDPAAGLRTLAALLLEHAATLETRSFIARRRHGEHRAGATVLPFPLPHTKRIPPCPT